MEPITNESIRQIEDQYTSGVYTKRPVAIVRGLEAHLWDADGKEYIDCVGGQGAANLGHANPVVAQAIADQAKRLISCPEMFYNDSRAALEEKLISLTGMGRVFLSNSGTEAVEAASSLPACSPGAPKWWPPCAASTGARWAPCRPPGRRNTASRSSRWCPVSRTSPITTRPLLKLP